LGSNVKIKEIGDAAGVLTEIEKALNAAPNRVLDDGQLCDQGVALVAGCEELGEARFDLAIALRADLIDTGAGEPRPLPGVQLLTGLFRCHLQLPP